MYQLDYGYSIVFQYDLNQTFSAKTGHSGVWAKKNFGCPCGPKLLAAQGSPT